MSTGGLTQVDGAVTNEVMLSGRVLTVVKLQGSNEFRLCQPWNHMQQVPKHGMVAAVAP
jgi:hypothetical protein